MDYTETCTLLGSPAGLVGVQMGVKTSLAHHGGDNDTIIITILLLNISTLCCCSLAFCIYLIDFIDITDIL